MTTLIVDTSTDKSLVIFARKTEVISTIFLPIGTQGSRHVMQCIEEGFKKWGISTGSLKAVAAALGPGSFTGIRVGAAAAYGLSLALNLPLIGFCSLEGFVNQDVGKFASLIDARIGGSYVLLQERNGGKVAPIASPQFVANEQLENYLNGVDVRVGPQCGYPDARHLACLVEEKFDKGEYGSRLELIYLRTPDYMFTSATGT